MVIKKSGTQEEFDKSKIEKSILRAMRTGSGIYKKKLAELITEEAEKKFSSKDSVDTGTIDEYIQKALTSYGQDLTAQAFVKYRTLKEYRKQDNEIVESVLGIVDQTNQDILNENANKNFRAYGTQRDLIAGEVSKLIARHIIPEELMLAHQEGIIHIHDLDYFSGTSDHNGVAPGMFNCCLVNLKDIFDNGTVINNKQIKGVNSFSKAATIASQVALVVSSSQLGGQTMSISHLSPMVRSTRERWRSIVGEDKSLTEEQINNIVDRLTKKEIQDGVQTLNYQLNTFSSSNGQTPFISLFIYLSEDPEYIEETALLAEEIFRQRIKGLPNRYGHPTIQTFPKLLYVLEENNLPGGGGKYEYLSHLAAECTAKTMNPDYISAKIMSERYKEVDPITGEVLHSGVFPCMGCRSFLSKWINPETGKPQYYGRYNKGVQSINLPDVALSAKGDIDMFWKILEERLELVRRVGQMRHESLLKNATNLDGAAIHWKYGSLKRYKDGESFAETLFNGYSTLSLGYIGIYEMCMALLGKSNTSPEGSKLAKEVLEFMKAKTEEWNKEEHIGWSLYSTPSEGYCQTSYRKTRKRFGEVPGVTDHGYFTNSYHVFVGEKINAMDKIEFESTYGALSTGGNISYIEIGNLSGNLEAIEEVMKHIYHNIQYAELNTECDRCNECGSTAALGQDEQDNFFCKECGSYNVEAVRRVCGYLGVASSGINSSKRHEMSHRVKHIN